MYKPAAELPDDFPEDVLGAINQTLPRIPEVIRYYDDFDDRIRSISRFSEEMIVSVYCNGRKYYISFGEFSVEYRQIMKSLFFFMVSGEISVITGCGYLSGLKKLDKCLMADLLASSPADIKLLWQKLVACYSSDFEIFPAVKMLLVFLAKHNLGRWSYLYLDFIRISLPYPHRDRYIGVRSGDVFLSSKEESLIVEYLDDFSNRAKDKSQFLLSDDIAAACMLACSFLFGMRPLQIALLTMRDVRIWESDSKHVTSVHLTFKMVKQKTKSNAFPLQRRVHHKWAPIFVEHYSRSQLNGISGSNRLFSINSSHDVGMRIARLASLIVGVDVTATDLRHTAAQRLVDAGASQEEVAEFMGHSSITTCLVYYATSPTQAERVNTALGISSIYQQVVKIAHDKFISPKELARLKGDQQIAGVPHGIPIAGIGGCSTGQTSCPYNPITSCYGCSKFMPIADAELHKKVLMDLRCVVLFFEKSSRGDSNSPAFMQLKRTITQVQGVIEELGVISA